MKKNKVVIAGILIVMYFILIYVIDMNFSMKNYELLGSIGIIAIALITALSIIKDLRRKRKLDFKKIIIAIIIIGLIIRTVYILYTPITLRQHDVQDENGHLDYIETIYEENELPQTNKWQFYHQPLHHIIAALWLKINNMIGIELDIAEEGIQFLTAIYSSLIMLITYSILKELKISDKYKILVILIVAVHPTFIFLSGSINNDIIMIMFTMFTLLYLIKWHKNPSYKNTIIMALFTACTVLSKISGAVVAIPIMYVFIEKFLVYFREKNKNVIGKYIIKLIIFGTISLTLGLCYSVRNIILFSQPIFGVPQPVITLYCGDNSLLSRLNIFSSEWKEIYAYPGKDCNIISFLIKSSLFGEYNIEIIGANIMSVMMLIINVIIILISLISFIKISNKKKSVITSMLIIFYITELVSYLFINLNMPYSCTMDIRYIVPTIILGMIFIAMDMEKSKLKKFKGSIIYLSIFSFAILSTIFELIYMQYLTW